MQPTNMTFEIPEPVQIPVIEQFLNVATQNPTLLAVSQGDLQWTYQELAGKVKRLATTLSAQEFQRGDVIAIVGSRSIATVTAMLSIMMSGCVFVTIDTTLSIARQKLIIEQAGSKAIISTAGEEASWHALTQEFSNLKQFLLESNSGELIGAVSKISHVEMPVINSHDAAYIFFTSGSTGTPKGILGVHKGLSHFVNWQQNQFSIGPGDKVSQLTNIAFDVVLRDIFTPLTCGATLCIPSDYEHLNPLVWIASQRITVVHTTPTLLQTWLLMTSAELDLSALRWLFMAGEPLLDTLVAQWRSQFAANGKMVNLYGPTETTMAKCFYPIPDQLSPGIQPIGQAMPQTQALVLAEDGRLCETGELGEIVIRTPFRSLGYINLPDETQNRFRQNPHLNNPNDLLYFTGDVGRYRTDGLLEIAGRKDDQVKIRGVRVEPVEIMTCLATHAAVQNCFVLAKKNEEGHYELVAYVVLKAGENADTKELRNHLSQKLPPAYVPSYFLFLNDLPRLPNGKTDRNALPVPTRTQPIIDNEFVAPQTPLQQQLAEIWCSVLTRETIGIHDNFFELGGHSLLATLVITQVNALCDTQLPLGILYQLPTIEQLAKGLVADDKEPNSYYSLVPIQAQGHRPPLFAVHTITLQDLPAELGKDQPLYFLRYGMAGESSHRAVKLPALDALAAHYIAEMQKVQPIGPYYLVGFSFGGIIAYEMARQLVAKSHQVNLVGLLDSYLSMEKLSVGLYQKIHRLIDQPSKRLLQKLKLKITEYFNSTQQNGTDFWPHFYTSEPDAICRSTYQMPIYEGKVILFQGDEWDSLLTKYALPEGAWRNLLGDRLEIQQVTGSHFHILEAPHVRILAAKIISAMDKAIESNTEQQKFYA